ncbi:probable protein phosphatase 2C 60 isoform X2 [Sesamum indicum]|uniref:protein-serine/threonine phosphatase n=1 Tax=Sesamum indicum TaxID=4182 RepID=A0A6I9SZL8_SESIN|nr:probable protein phosphatase 2C 60 isoform X2 [Sesamum indicum]
MYTYMSVWLKMGVYLSTPKTEKASEDGENDRLRYGLSSMQGWRATMEDAHAAFTNLDGLTSFFGVYDGHGGKEVSRFCAKFLHHQVLQHEAYAAGDLGTSVRKAFLRMDEMMCGKTGQKELALLKAAADHSSSNGQNLPESDDQNGQTNHWPSEEGINSGYKGPSSGTTACVAIIRNNQLLVANAGDSRCVICRKGKAHDLSKDHKPELAAEKKRILEAGGYIQYGRVNGSLNLARAIGDMEMKQNKSLPAEKQIVTANPDIVTVELTEDDDFLIVACDGIWDCLSSQQAVDFVKEQLKTEKKLSAVCERVLDRCLAPSSGQEGCDNMTMILVQFKKSMDQKPSSKQQPGPSAK